MIAFLKRPVVLIAIGLVLAAVVIWFVGPMIPLFGSYPLASYLVQFELWLAIVLGVVAWHLYKRARAGAASDQLMGEMVEQAKRRGSEAAELQRKFEEAVAFLKQNRRKGASLYDLPWYAIIGAPGAGKTTALSNSGLQFPMEKKGGRRPVKGVGGTRNCDWFFTQEAVLLDTAGRYTTQDANEESDSSAWTEFLNLLKKYRRRRPLNGVLLTVSVRDLVEFGPRQLDDYVSAARQRLDELSTQLGIPLPVYVLVTKCDLVPGFTEYFSDLNRDGRGQVWGVTFPFERTLKGDAADMFPEELEALLTRLNERLYARLDAEQDPARRTRVFAFPQEMAALREPLADFVGHVFGSTRFEKRVLLRGVYLTSATQHGTTFDRLAGALAEHLSLPEAAMAPGAGSGKAYFIERLLKDVILAESGIAGTNFRFELRKAAAQVGVYAAIIAIAAVTVGGLLWSYKRNSDFIAEVAAEAAPVGQTPAPAVGAIETQLPRLGAIRRVVDTSSRYADDVPFGMRWGLYQGRSLTATANDAYGADLHGALLPWLFARFERRLNDYGAQSELLYGYLKGYLMLTRESAHQNVEHLTGLAAQEFYQVLPPDDAAALTNHAEALFKRKPVVASYDETLVARARGSITNASIPRLVYDEVRASYGEQPGVRVDLAGAGFDRMFSRKGNQPITAPVPGVFTPDVFFDAVDRGIDDAAARFAKDQWVWGEGAPPAVPIGTKRQVIELYEADYIKTWQSVLDDFELLPVSGREQTADLLIRLSAPTSPLRGLLQIVDANTYLEPPAAAGAGGGIAGAAAGAATAAAGRVANRVTGGLAGRLTRGGGGAQAQGTAGASVKEHFAKLHEQMAGSPAPFDSVLGLLKQMGDLVNKTGAGVVGGIPAADAAVQMDGLKQQLGLAAETLPPSVGATVSSAGASAGAAVGSETAADMLTLYKQEILKECVPTVAGKYPFAPGGADAPPGDVAKLFGQGGTFDAFFSTRLATSVDPRNPAQWKVDASGRAVGGPPSLPPRLQAATDVREGLFPLRTSGPLSFALTPIAFDRSVTQAVLQVDSQTYTLRPNQQQPARLTWSPLSSGFASITIEGAPPIEERGPWALLRLFDRGQVIGSGSRATVTFGAPGREVRLQLDAQNAKNPITSKNLLRFQCGI